MLHEEEAQTLMDLGLTALQAKVYVGLVRLGNPTANATAKFSKVARQEVYRITNELMEMGLVSRIVTTPTKFKPLPLKDAISFLLERRIKKTRELQVEAAKLVKEAAKKGVAIQQDSFEFLEIPEKGPWPKKCQVMMHPLETFDLLTSLRRFTSWITSDAEKYRKALKRGVKIRVIIEKPQSNSPILRIINALRRDPAFMIRYLLTPPQVVLIIADKKEVALATSPLKPAGPPYLFSNHPSFVLLVQEHFETAWNTALAPERLPKGAFKKKG